MATDTAGAEVQREVERIVDELTRRRGRIADDMTAAIRAEISPYSGVEPGVLDDVRAHCLAHAALILEVSRDGRVPQRNELRFAREAAGRRVRQGIPLDGLLQAFRVGHRTIWEAIVAESEDTLQGRDAAIALARPAMEYIDICSTQVAEAYMKEEQRQVVAADRERRDLLEDLLAGRLPLAEERPAATQLDPEAELAVAIARPETGDAHALQHVADTLAANAVPGGVEPLLVQRQREVVCVLPVDQASATRAAEGLRACTRAVHEKRGIVLRVGLSTVRPGFAGVARAFEEARRALRRTTPEQPVMALTEMSPFEYLVASADAGTRRAVLDKGRAVLEADRDGSARETLLAYVATGLNVKEAAARLFVHPNTVRYRLRRLSEQTGRDVRSPSELMDLITVIAVAQEAGPPDGPH